MVQLTASSTVRDFVQSGRARQPNVDMSLSSLLQHAPIHAHLPLESDARFFSVETLFSGDYVPVGVHKPWAYLRGSEEKRALLARLYGLCPEIRLINPDFPS